MLYQLLLSLFINNIFARNYDLLCSINTIPVRYHLHCFRSGIQKLSSEYEKCEKFEYLEYYQCAYNIYKFPKEQVDFFSRYDEITLMCDSCGNIKKGMTLKANYCNKDQLKEFKSYYQCLEDNTGESRDQFGDRIMCQIGCDIDKGIPEYADCIYKCEKSIVNKVVSSIGNSSTLTNNSESTIPFALPTTIPNSKNSSMRLYSQFNIYSVYSARDFELTCIYQNFLLGYFIHCESNDQAKLTSEYDKCETKAVIDLEYYKCVYKIYQLPTDHFELFTRLHWAAFKCKNCEYTQRWNFKNPKICTNKTEISTYTTYNDCLLYYLGIYEDEVKKKEACVVKCDLKLGIPVYSDCAYQCYSDIAKRVVEHKIKKGGIINNTRIDGDEGDKSNALLSLYLSSVYSIITLILITTLL
ncbi:hypothetical protein CONCODRAFT_16253 [Conidiobolus coronatus NRRL 28638]|uniref:Folate receptor-like domain-containing protein n=1 Tax=Conidiobolus coronatus (strain ATCC 28846 / CBS 209.66 / NRRL 28638) TaxID=796925 RepID=A0A137PBM3_CONC2|nr:hypothetical protein CONCODRAFT_16253 [Conidiobolus coronatus NRRL 28638]|eukprot:KXN72331.1 hypothetical protein CONCODRAFT_16253 [Conidiobolus coronatus NRRL 28638]